MNNYTQTALAATQTQVLGQSAEAIRNAGKTISNTATSVTSNVTGAVGSAASSTAKTVSQSAAVAAEQLSKAANTIYDTAADAVDKGANIIAENTANVTGVVTDKLFDVDLGSPLLNSIKNQAIDKGQNFLVGKAVSQFVNSEAVGATMQIAGQTASVVGNAASVAGTVSKIGAMAGANAELITQLTQKMATSVINKSTACAQSYAMKAVQLATVSFPADIQSRTAYWTKTYVLKTSEIMDMLFTDEEEIAKEKSEEEQKQNKNKTIESIKNCASYITTIANDRINEAKPYINNIASYVAEGPSFVQKQMNRLSKDVMINIYQMAGQRYNDAITMEQQAADDMGKTFGMAAANIINTAAKQAAWNAKQLLNRTMLKNTKMAKAVAKQAILIIKGLMGL